MTTAEIQRLLQTLRRESRSGPTLREMWQQPKDDGDWSAIIAAMEAKGLKYFKPGPGHRALRLASFSFVEQEQILACCERLVDEAHAICMRFQDWQPTMRESDRDVDGLYRFERWYRAQLHAMERLRRCCDGAKWARAHTMKARRWLEQPQMESVN